MDKELQNLRISEQTPLLSPRELSKVYPLPVKAKDTVLAGRQAVRDILNRKNSRKIIIVGPCSVHDTVAALDYAHRLKKLSEEVADTFLIIMRVYFEKPRTAVGWKGLINDPDLNGTFDMEKGLHIARKLLIDINTLGLPTGTEALDPICPQYLGDLISWTVVGARTAESQTHREMSSGLSTPIGFKNSTDGSLDVAINAIESASRPHSFLGIDADGRTSITRSLGNQYGHIVLRGGNKMPNYDSVHVALCEEALQEKNLPKNIIIDCSHANSDKNPNRQPLVMRDIMHQIADGNASIVGLMLESNIHEGTQILDEDPSQLKYGVSITDACMSWKTTEKSIREARLLLKKANQP